MMFCSLILNGQTLRDTLKIREINIFGKRVPQETGLKITRTDSMAIASSISADLGELLQLNTPVFIKSYGRGSSATASFRGTSSSHTKLVWNGMNLNSPMRGSADLSLLPVMFIDNLWLLHGGSSLAEGTGALGGSIHLGNKPDWSVNTHLSALAERGSFNTGSYLFRFQAGGKQFRAVTRLLADHSDNNFPFYNVGVLPYRNDTLKNAAYRKLAVLQEFYLRPNNEKLLALRFWTQGNRRDLPQLMSYEGTRRMEQQKDEQFRAQLEIKDYNTKFKYHYYSGFNFTNLNYKRYNTDPLFINDDAASRESSLFNQIRANSDLTDKLNLHGSMEANYHWVKVRNPVRNTGYEESRLEAGVMLHAQYRPVENWGFFAIVRSEWYDRHMTPLIPAAGMEYSAKKPANARLQFNIARNFNKPSLNDLYWIPGGNPGLLPEDGVSANLSVSAESNSPGLWRNEVTFFYSLIDNWIIWQPAASGAWYWEAANIKKVFSRGIEYNFSSQAELGSVIFRLAGNYAFTRSTNENAVSSVDLSRGRQLIYTPKHSGNLRLSGTCDNWTIKGNLTYTGKRYTQSSNEWTFFESVLNPFWMTTLSIEKIWQLTPALVINTQLKANNLLNANYQQILWRPMPGRHYTFTLALKWRK